MTMISVVIPCYNCENTVERAVSSVINQSYDDWEIILVNNNSSDGTQQKLEYLRDKYPHQVHIEQQAVPGAPSTRNLGLSMSRGEWIQFLDADDELKPDKFDSNINIINSNLVDVVIGNFEIVRDGRLKGGPEVRRADNENIWRGLICSRLGVTSANLWRKHALDQINGWDTNLSSSQEYDLLFRLLKFGGKVAFDSSINTILHVSSNSVSQTTSDERLKIILMNMINLRFQIREYLFETGRLTSELKQAINTFLYLHLMNKKKTAPKVVEDILSNIRLDVPLMLKLKTSLKQFLRK